MKLLWPSHHRRIALQAFRFHPPGADRAAAAIGGSGGYRRLVFMPQLTASQYLLPAAVGNAVRRQGKVLSAIPLEQQVFFSIFRAEVIE